MLFRFAMFEASVNTFAHCMLCTSAYDVEITSCVYILY